MRVEAAGFKDAAVIRAQREAESLKLVSEALAANPNLLMYRYIEKLAPNTQVMMVPNNVPFIFDLKGLGASSAMPSPTQVLPVQPTAEPQPQDRGVTPTPTLPSFQ